uniref:Uncharacterized protein n=1 Tax=Sus scrofa TaxID=9823 RepID=A0A8D1YD51_PIG
MKYHLTLVRVAIINKFTNNTCWRGCGEKGTLLHCWWECKLPLWRTVWRYLRNLYIDLPYDPAIPLLEKKIMNLENRLVVAKEEGVGWIGELGVNGCKLLPLEWISNEILLCSTGNCV